MKKLPLILLILFSVLSCSKKNEDDKKIILDTLDIAKTKTAVILDSVSPSNNSDKTQIYSEILNTFGNAKTIVIDDSASIRYSHYNFENYKESLNGIEKETSDDFIKKNKLPIKLRSNDFKTKKKIVFVSRKEKEKIFDDADGWENFYKMYENSQGILELSNIGFNRAKTQALVYYGNQSDFLAGAGYLVLFQKINGNWEIKYLTMLWIS
ncbi:MAG: hypothetical protein LBE36_03945 [Flavobacteriaceae bacterium]|jgi:hypothetical protein|nr:hypothetical protein [Flavobacteriaceae bacterium]